MACKATGGRKLPDSRFKPGQIRKGICVEQEHGKGKAEAKRIAKDHLIENPCYYDYLDAMERKMSKKPRCR